MFKYIFVNLIKREQEIDYEKSPEDNILMKRLHRQQIYVNKYIYI